MDKLCPFHHDPGELGWILNWVDERFGPILRLWGLSLLPPEPRWWVYGCDLARLPVGTWFSREHFAAAGASIDPDEALRRALGEAVERYSGLSESVPAGSLLLSPADNPIANVFPVCAPDEPCPQSFKDSRGETPVTHVQMVRLSNDGAVLVPAAHVYLGFSPPPPEPLVALPISTGLSFHTQLHRAIWGGLCEVVERDAMMLMWWTRQSIRQIDLTAPRLPECLVSRLERLRQVGLTAHLFDMSTDFRVPSVFCLVTGEHYPYVIAGAACHADPIAACAKALDEGASARLVTSGGEWSRDIPSTSDFSWVRQLEQHLLLYAGWRSSPAFEFLWHAKGDPLPLNEFVQAEWWQPPSDMKGLKTLAARLEAQGLTVLWTEVTAPEAEGFGFVVKVVVPQMVPLSQDHNVRWLATPRLLRAAGLRQADVSAFNKHPHPFA